MVKNNDKQFQRFQLPKDADFWSCHVNGQPAKPERDADWLLVPLPRGANRDQAFAVDIVYAEKKGGLDSLLPRPVQLAAPRTDVPNTYAEWHLYAPSQFRLSGFGGSMSVARGTTYGLRDAWRQFAQFYDALFHEAGAGLVLVGSLLLLLVALVASAVRRKRGVTFTLIEALMVVAVVAIFAALLLPAMSTAKSKAQRISALSNLRQIGGVLQQFADDNEGRLPGSLEESKNYIRGDGALLDPQSAQPFIYVGGGLALGSLQPDSVLAYSPADNNGRVVLFADGSVQQVNRERFEALAGRGFVRVATPEEAAARKQKEAVFGSQFRAGLPTAQTVQPPPAQPASAGAYEFGRMGTGGAGVIEGRGPRGVEVAPPMAAGIRSIRIDIPRTGQPFTFTKVLNVLDEPLSVRVNIMKRHTFQMALMALQLVMFVAGLALGWWQWRARRNSFLLTLALALVIGAVGSLLITWRWLHVGFIIAAPLLALVILAVLIGKFWPRRASEEAVPTDAAGTAPAAPPVVAAIALLCCVPGAWADSGKTARAEPESALPAVSVLSAHYTGTVAEHVAQLAVTLQVSAAKAGQKVPLFGEEVAVQQFSAKPGDARLVRDGKTVAALLLRRGETTLQMKLLVKLGGDVTQRQLAFAIPAALTSQLSLTLDQEEADVEFPTAVSFKRVPIQRQTRVEAIMGSGERVELRWTPRVKRAAEIAATVMCHNATLVAFGGGAVNARTTLDYQVTQGELRQMRVRLPAGHRLLRVEGESIRTWEVKTENGEQVLVVELLKGVAPGYRLSVETEKMLAALPTTVKVETPHALDVKRETGLVALRGDEELELAVEKADAAQRVDVEEFARVTAQKAEGLLSAFHFLKPEFALHVRAAAVQPQVEAVVRNNIRVNTDWASISATVDYTIKRTGVFTLKLALPPGYRLDQVRGEKVRQWAERVEGGARVLEVSLKERTPGACSLNVELSKIYGALPQPLPIAGVQPLGAAKLTEFIAVAANPGIAVKTESFDGLTEIPAATLPDYNSLSGLPSVLAFKHISSDPKVAPDWKLAVKTETVEPWVRAEVINTLTLTETLVTGRALVRYDIANAPVAELRLKIPASFKNIEIAGDNIRRRDQTGEQWRVALQSTVRGHYTLTVTWEQPRDAQTSSLELAGVAADAVEREVGRLVIVARPPLQVSEHRAADLIRMDTRELPEWAGRPDEAAVLAYRYLRPGYRLALEAKRFDAAEVLQALVESARLTTVVADDGQTMTEMSLAVRNNARQHLEIELPPGAEVWSAFVAGQAVRPSRRDGKLLLPLERSSGEHAPIPIELTFVGTNRFPQNRGSVEFLSPRLDVPLKNARWELFLPPDYRYGDFAGSMNRETSAATPETVGFSLSEYGRREQQAKEALRQEATSDLSNVQKQLSEGNIQQAAEQFGRARAKVFYEDKAADFKKLGDELRRVQAGNLMMAQERFSAANAAQPPPGKAAGRPQQVVGYDAATAEAQWEKLQQAQELGVAKVRPLRVNLPTRGVRHAFTQVLQTEVDKPMTIRLLATSAKTVSWPTRLAALVGGFVLLWIGVAAFTRQFASRA